MSIDDLDAAPAGTMIRATVIDDPVFSPRTRLLVKCEEQRGGHLGGTLSAWVDVHNGDGASLAQYGVDGFEILFSPTPIPCGTCNGSGRVAVGPWGSRPPRVKCPACNGSRVAS